MSMAIPNLRYLTNERGRPQEVVLPLNVWKKITGELEMLREKQEILFGLKQACQEVKMQRKGKMSEETLEDFLNEL